MPELLFYGISNIGQVAGLKQKSTYGWIVSQPTFKAGPPPPLVQLESSPIPLGSPTYLALHRPPAIQRHSPTSLSQLEMALTTALRSGTASYAGRRPEKEKESITLVQMESADSITQVRTNFI